MIACDITDALDNWARWCRRVGDCYPAGWWGIAGSAECSLWYPYKNGDPSVQEKLEEVESQMEPHEPSALVVERAVCALDTPKRTAIRIHYVDMPDNGRFGLKLTAEEWDERRARVATRRARWYFTPKTYREAVDRAMDAIEREL